MEKSISKSIYLKSIYGAPEFYKALKSGFITSHNPNKSYKGAVNFAEWLLV